MENTPLIQMVSFTLNAQESEIHSLNGIVRLNKFKNPSFFGSNSIFLLT